MNSIFFKYDLEPTQNIVDYLYISYKNTYVFTFLVIISIIILSSILHYCSDFKGFVPCCVNNINDLSNICDTQNISVQECNRQYKYIFSTFIDLFKENNSPYKHCPNYFIINNYVKYNNTFCARENIELHSNYSVILNGVRRQQHIKIDDLVCLAYHELEELHEILQRYSDIAVSL